MFFLLTQSISFAKSLPIINLGDANQAPNYSSKLVCSNLAHGEFTVTDTNEYGVLIEGGIGMYSTPSPTLVIRQDGKVRELDLQKMFKGDIIRLVMDEEGFLFLENQVKFGCHYEIACISPTDKVLWIKPFTYGGDCLGGDTWGISVELSHFDKGIYVDYYERLPTGEFAMRIKNNSAKLFYLKDKLNNEWEIVLPENNKGYGENMNYYSIPNTMKEDCKIAYKNGNNTTIGWVQIKEAYNPKVSGQPTRLVDLYKDKSGKLYALYFYDSPLGNAYSDFRYVVTYSKDGLPTGKYEIKPGEKFRMFQTYRFGEHPYNEKGEIYFSRSRDRQHQDLLKLTLQ